MTCDLEQFTDNPESLLDILESIVTDCLKKLDFTEDQHTSNTQLIEISKTIERLEKAKVAVPESLRSEKVRLFAEVNSKSREMQQLASIYSRTSKLMSQIEPILKTVNGKKRNSRGKTPKEHSWMKKQTSHEELTNPDIYETISAETQTDFRFMKIKRVFVIDAWYETRNWRDVKINVYNCLLTEKPDIELNGILSYSKKESAFRHPIRLIQGYFTEGNLSASDLVKQCRESMLIAGYIPSKHLIFEIVKR